MLTLPEAGVDRDRKLAMAFLGGDVDAFAIIVQDHYAALLAQARRNLGPNGQPEDAVQETFERALKGMKRFGLTGEYRLAPWLGRILVNVCNDQRGRAARQFRVLEAAAAQPRPESDVADWVSDPRTVAIVRKALDELPQTHRRALVLHELDGLPYEDVAEVEHISIENARARVSRGKSSLRRRLNSLRGFVLLPGLRFFLWDRRLARMVRGSEAGGKAGKLRSGHGSPLVDQVATKVASTPLGQSAFALMSAPPRGTFVFGLAATVATVGASTVLLNQPSSPPAQPVVASAVSSHVATAPSAPRAATLPAPTAPPPAPMTSGSNSAPTTPSYSWVNPGHPSGSVPGVPLASLPASAPCVSTNGVAAPGAGFSFGPPLGAANAVSVGNTPTVLLSTTGSALSFTSPLSVSAFPGTSSNGETFNVAASSCLTSDGWLTALLTGTGPAGSAVSMQLEGVLQEVIGSTGDLGYIFRGTVVDAGAATPALDAQQFVAQVVVAEPDNTAQLTIVFLGDGASASPGAPGGSVSGASITGAEETSSAVLGASPSSATSTSTSDSTTGAPVVLPPFAPITTPISSGL